MENKKYNLKKKQNGITLVSLIITIIILIIIAGVSIGVINDGIISDADEVTKQYNNRIAKEDAIVKDLMENRDEIIGDISQDEGEGEDPVEPEVPVVPVVGFVVTFLAITGQVFSTKENVTTLEFPDETPTKSGYNFTGWYYDEDCTNKAVEGTSISANSTLYAGWKSQKVEAISNKQNGEEINIEISNQENIEIIKYTTDVQIVNCQIIEVDDSGVEDSFGMGEDTGIVLTEESFEFVIDTNNSKVAILSLKSVSEIDGLKRAKVKIRINFVDETYDTDEFIFESYLPCLAEGTMIKLNDGTEKAIEEITYEDELLVWDFDKGCLASAKPLWIQEERKTGEYNLLKFENGSELKTISQHRIFSKDLGKFTYPMTDETPIGTTTITSEGKETKLVSKEVVTKDVKYYNIITDYHMNLFANDILTSCRLSNLYTIKNMKYVKDNRQLTPREEYKNIPDNYFTGLRLAEQPKEINRGNDIRHDNSLEEYVTRLINTAKKV